MPEIIVAAQNRAETGKNANRRLRVAGMIPGVLYGEKKDTMQIAVSPKEIAGILRSASGENTLFDLDLGGSRRKVILKEYQTEPLKGRLLHADFYEVALDKELHIKVHIEITGTAIGVKRDGGIIDFVTRELEITCLPTDIPERIVVDVTDLEMNKHIRVHDLKLDPKLKVLTHEDVVIVHVVAPRAEEEVAAAAAPAEGATPAEPEVIKAKGKAEDGDEKAEGKADEKPAKADKAEKKDKK
jgi:large subunit ribosomal protein L25